MLMAQTVMMLHTVALVIRVQALAVGTAQEGDHEHLPVMVVDMNVKPNDGGQITYAQEYAGNGRYDCLTFHQHDKFNYFSLILCD